ncbi:hypothetical protein [Streptomyces sp. NPDC005438]|uniref:hypothetical protein n=1 Tax=Streptomyces sp. NPDC005438 TaxID=3156880 RepID=UPI0033BD0879
MGWTVLYIAFGIVALWLMGEVLLQFKARLRWRVLALGGFLGVVAGVALHSVVVIALGAIAFAIGQTFVTLSFRRGFSTGWALGGMPGVSRRRRQYEERQRQDEEGDFGDQPDYGDHERHDGRRGAPAGRFAEPPEGPPTTYQLQPLPDDTEQYGVYGRDEEPEPEPDFGYQEPSRPYAQPGAYPGAGAPSDPYSSPYQETHPDPAVAYSSGPSYPGTDWNQSPFEDDPLYGPMATPAGAPGQQPPGYGTSYGTPGLSGDTSGSGYDTSGYGPYDTSGSGFSTSGFATSGYDTSGYDTSGSGYDTSGYRSGYDTSGSGYDTSGYDTSGSGYDTSGYQSGYDAYGNGGWVPQQRDGEYPLPPEAPPAPPAPDYPYPPSYQDGGYSAYDGTPGHGYPTAEGYPHQGLPHQAPSSPEWNGYPPGEQDPFGNPYDAQRPY